MDVGALHAATRCEPAGVIVRPKPVRRIVATLANGTPRPVCSHAAHASAHARRGLRRRPDCAHPQPPGPAERPRAGVHAVQCAVAARQSAHPAVSPAAPIWSSKGSSQRSAPRSASARAGELVSPRPLAAARSSFSGKPPSPLPRSHGMNGRTGSRACAATPARSSVSCLSRARAGRCARAAVGGAWRSAPPRRQDGRLRAGVGAWPFGGPLQQDVVRRVHGRGTGPAAGARAPAPDIVDPPAGGTPGKETPWPSTSRSLRRSTNSA